MSSPGELCTFETIVSMARAPYMPSCSAYASSITSTLPLQISSSAAVFSSVPPTAEAMRSDGVRT